MLPPILEIYVVWHPDDVAGAEVADAALEHFRGSTYSGLIGGAIEVYLRSESRDGSPAAAPPPLPAIEPPAYDLAVPAFTAVLVVASAELASAVDSPGPWREYLEAMAAAHADAASTIGVFPVSVAKRVLDGTYLSTLVGAQQQVAVDLWAEPNFHSVLCRDLGQGIAQMADVAHQRLKVFVSHTKHQADPEKGDGPTIVEEVRALIAQTRLQEFFDAADLQPGEDWAPKLIAEAGSSALLAVRTDLYSSRSWCQREVATAKRHGMPVVMLDALTEGEERGSFLMDHVPRVATRRDADGWRKEAVVRGLNQLVDECLKRALWRVQSQLGAAALRVDIDWWADHAPEPATFANWLSTQVDRTAKENEPIVVLHPDPPLGPDEREVLEEIGKLAGLNGPFEFLTPRGLAVHGG